MDVDQIPKEKLDEIKSAVLQQITAMKEAELRVVSQSETSLAHFIAGAFQAVAQLMGFVIAYPIAMAMRVAKEVLAGAKAGWDAAFRAAGV